MSVREEFRFVLFRFILVELRPILWWDFFLVVAVAVEWLLPDRQTLEWWCQRMIGVICSDTGQEEDGRRVIYWHGTV